MDKYIGKIIIYIYRKIYFAFQKLSKTKIAIYSKEAIEYRKFERSFVKDISSDFIISSESECLYRKEYYNDKNKILVQLCKDNDIAGIQLWYGNADSDKMYYDEFFEHRMSMRILAKYIDFHVPKNKSILDVACGHGSIDKVLSKKGYKVVGIDLNPNRIRELQGYIYDAICIDVNSISKEHKYGIIISLEMLEHVPDVRKTLANMYMLLEEKGLCFISVPYEKMIDDEQHVRFFSSDSMIALLREAGFTVKAATRLPYLNHEKNNDLICVCEKQSCNL